MILINIKEHIIDHTEIGFSKGSKFIVANTNCVY